MFNQKLLLCSFTVLVFTLTQAIALATEDATLNGLNIQKNGSKTQIKLDVEKSTQAKVKKNADGSVVIQLPKTKLPKAYQEFGMPNIKQNGVSASVQSKGDTVEITVPNAGNLEVKLSNGKTVKSSASSSNSTQKTMTTTVSKKPVVTTTKTATTSKPKIVTKTVKAPVKVVTQSKPVTKKPVVTTTATKAKAPTITTKTTSTTKTAVQKPTDEILDLEALTKPQANSSAQKAATATGAATATSDKNATSQESTTTNDGSEILNLDNNSDTPPTAETPETVESKLPGPREPITTQPTSDIDSLLQTWVYAPLTEFQNATSSVLGANWMNDWGFLALAAVGGLLIAFVILSTLIRLLFGKKQPKAKKAKPAKKNKKAKISPQSQLQEDEEELYIPNQDEFVAYQQQPEPVNYDQANSIREPEVAQAPRFENFIQEDIATDYTQQPATAIEPQSLMPPQHTVTQATSTASSARRHNARVNNPGGVPEHLKRSSENLEGTNARFLNMVKKQQNG